jgi:small subunit ribosomal protein S9
MVNDKEGHEYFPTAELKSIMHAAFEGIKSEEHYDVSVHVSGSGIHSQAEAVRHGISRVLVEINAELRGELKKLGFLKRDPRAKERRKFGLKKARKAPQWSKR